MRYIEVQTATETMKFSPLILGTHMFGMNGATYEDAEKLLDCYIDAGGNVLDTARCAEYFRSEEFIGEYFKRHPEKRDKIYVCTKWGNPQFNAEHTQIERLRFTPEDFRADMAESLRLLQMDCVDIYLLHKYHPSIDPVAILKLMNEAVAEGHARHIGVSNWPVEAVQQANAYAEAHGLRKFEFNEIAHSLYVGGTEGWGDLEMAYVHKEHEMAEYQKMNMTVFCFTSQGGGFFYRNFDLPIEEAVDKRGKPENIERLRRVKMLCEKKNLIPQQVVLGYFSAQECTTIPAATTRRPEHLKPMVEAASTQLTREEVLFLEGKGDMPV